MAPNQRTILLCGGSPYLLDRFSALALDDGWVPRVAKTPQDLPARLAAAPAGSTVVVVDLSVKSIPPELVLQAIRGGSHPAPLVGVLPPGMPPEQIKELKAAGFAWVFETSTPEHEIRFALKSLTAPPPPEHRKDPRAPADFEASFWVGTQPPRRGVVRDLTEGGLFIETGERYMLGELVTVRFEVPDPPATIQAHAEVVFSSPKMDHASSLLPGNGLKFRDLSPEASEAIRAYVERALKRLPGPAAKSLIGMRGGQG